MKRIVLALMMCLVCSVSFADEVYFETNKIILDCRKSPCVEVEKLPEGEIKLGEYLITAKELQNFKGNCKFKYIENNKVIARCNSTEANINALKTEKNISELTIRTKKDLLKNQKMTPYVKAEFEISQKIKEFFGNLGRMAFAAQSYTDDFNRDNGALGDNWGSFGAQTCTIDNNEVVTTVDSSTYCAHDYVNAMDTDDQYVSIENDNITNTQAVCVVARYDPDTDDGYVVCSDDFNDNTYTYRIDNNVFTQISNVSQNPSAGSYTRIRVTGSDIKAYYNTTLKDTTVDATYTTGKYTGFAARDQSATNVDADNWSAVDEGEEAATGTPVNDAILNDVVFN